MHIWFIDKQQIPNNIWTADVIVYSMSRKIKILWTMLYTTCVDN